MVAIALAMSSPRVSARQPGTVGWIIARLGAIAEAMRSE
ncbi:Uncharacterised protein [Mycobacteroides abscessus subsp. abscessus]|nr:Uncharacterised protein [Mycobacteroides abscessus subsp. abscessus]